MSKHAFNFCCKNVILSVVEKMIQKLEVLIQEKANLDDVVHMYQYITNTMTNIITVIDFKEPLD